MWFFWTNGWQFINGSIVQSTWSPLQNEFINQSSTGYCKQYALCHLIKSKKTKWSDSAKSQARTSCSKGLLFWNHPTCRTTGALSDAGLMLQVNCRPSLQGEFKATNPFSYKHVLETIQMQFSQTITLYPILRTRKHIKNRITSLMRLWSALVCLTQRTPILRLETICMAALVCKKALHFRRILTLRAHWSFPSGKGMDLGRRSGTSNSPKAAKGVGRCKFSGSMRTESCLAA